jgi:hypothetical protein
MFVILLQSCYEVYTPDERFHRLIPPIILVAESEDGSVILTDATNEYVEISKIYVIALTISQSYNVGDTIFYNKDQGL